MANRSKKWPSWGIKPSESMRHQLGGDCPYCHYYDRDDKFSWYIVGFSSDELFRQPVKKGKKIIEYKAGALVVKCPQCNRYFWHHTLDPMPELIRDNAEFEPEEFKVPGVCEIVRRAWKIKEGKRK